MSCCGTKKDSKKMPKDSKKMPKDKNEHDDMPSC